MKLRRMIVAASLAMSTLLMVGCSGGGSNQKSSDGAKELKLPTYLAGENVGAKFFLPQIERFNKANEGKYMITIEEVVQDSYGEKIKQLAAQKKLPALVHSPGSGGIDSQWFEQVILANNLAYDLNEFAKENPEVSKNWIEESKDFCTYEGKLVCNPLTVLRPIGLYTNTSLYNPKKEVRDMSVEEFIQSLGENKVAFMTAENAWTSSLTLAALIANEDGGVEYLNSHTDDKIWDYTDPIFVNAVEKLRVMLQEHASSNSLGAAYADAANAFMSNNAAVICNGSWMAGEFEEGSKDKWSNGFDGKDVKAGIYFGNIALANPKGYGDFWIASSASEDEIEVAKAFLAFRGSQDEIERFILAEGGNAPKLTYSKDFLSELEKNPILYQLSNSMNEGTKYVATLGDVLPTSITDQELSKLLPKLIDGSLDAKGFCEELTKKAQEVKQ